MTNGPSVMSGIELIQHIQSIILPGLMSGIPLYVHSLPDQVWWEETDSLSEEISPASDGIDSASEEMDVSYS